MERAAWNLAGRMTFPLWSGGSLMSNEPNGHRTAVILFGVAVIVAIFAALITTVERIDTRTASMRARPVRRASPGLTRRSIAHQASRY